MKVLGVLPSSARDFARAVTSSEIKASVDSKDILYHQAHAALSAVLVPYWGARRSTQSGTASARLAAPPRARDQTRRDSFRLPSPPHPFPRSYAAKTASATAIVAALDNEHGADNVPFDHYAFRTLGVRRGDRGPGEPGAGGGGGGETPRPGSSP